MKKLIRSEGLIKDHKREKMYLKEKYEKIENELASDKQHLKNHVEVRNQLEAQIKELYDQVTKLNENYNEINRKRKNLNEQRKLIEAKISSKTEEEREIKKKISQMQKEADVLRANIEEISENEEEINEDLETENLLEQSMQLLVNVSSNDSQQDLFHKLNKMETKVEQLEQKMNQLRRVVRFESEDLLNKLEKDVEFIGKHKGIVRGDLQNIKVNIRDLNRKKKFAVIKCFKKVNDNLFRIFSSLVPGAVAKMVLKNYAVDEEEENFLQEYLFDENAIQSKFFYV
jgi:chromosome segregation ATPase